MEALENAARDASGECVAGADMVLEKLLRYRGGAREDKEQVP